MACIFIGKPPDCSVCLDSMKLNCLLNHRHLLLTEDGKVQIRAQLELIMNDRERYKTKSGEEQRKE